MVLTTPKIKTTETKELLTARHVDLVPIKPSHTARSLPAPPAITTKKSININRKKSVVSMIFSFICFFSCNRVVTVGAQLLSGDKDNAFGAK